MHTVSLSLGIVHLNQLIVSRIEVAILSDVLRATFFLKQLARRPQVGIILRLQAFFEVRLVKS